MTECIILAAGYGTRLRPVTDKIPKAIFPIFNTPLIVKIMERMELYDITRFLVNVHYLAREVTNTVNNSSYKSLVYFQFEEELLLTGGGLKKLLLSANGEDVFVHNVDIVEEFDLQRLVNVHKKSKNDITWILSPQKGNVKIDGNSIAGFSGEGFVFTGVGMYKREISDLMPVGRFHLTDWISQALEEKRIKMGYVFDSAFWVDLGTPHGVFRAYRHELDIMNRKNILEGTVSGDLNIGDYVYVSKEVVLQGRGRVENAILLGKTFLKLNNGLRNRIIYDGIELTF